MISVAAATVASIYALVLLLAVGRIAGEFRVELSVEALVVLAVGVDVKILGISPLRQDIKFMHDQNSSLLFDDEFGSS